MRGSLLGALLSSVFDVVGADKYQNKARDQRNNCYQDKNRKKGCHAEIQGVVLSESSLR